MPDILSFRQELYRKFVHLSSVFIGLALWYFGKEALLPWLIVIAIIFPLLDYGRCHIPVLIRLYKYFFSQVTRPGEYHGLSGASWVFMGAGVTALIFDETTAVIALIVLSLSDSAAAIIGIRFGTTRFFQKSLEGTAAFFITSACIIFTLSPAYFLVNIAAVITATTVELVSTPKLNDNLLIPLSVAGILSLGGLF